MTVDALLAAAGARGLELTADGDRLRFRGPRGALTPDLRDALMAAKSELLVALRAKAKPGDAAMPSQRPEETDEVLRVARRAQSELAAAAEPPSDWPEDAPGILRTLRPALARDLDAAWLRLQDLARAVAGGERPWDAFVEGVARWRGLRAEAAEFLARSCHCCGRDASFAVVLDDGRRLCRPCLAPEARDGR